MKEEDAKITIRLDATEFTRDMDRVIGRLKEIQRLKAEVTESEPLWIRFTRWLKNQKRTVRIERTDERGAYVGWAEYKRWLWPWEKK